MACRTIAIQDYPGSGGEHPKVEPEALLFYVLQVPLDTFGPGHLIAAFNLRQSGQTWLDLKAAELM